MLLLLNFVCRSLNCRRGCWCWDARQLTGVELNSRLLKTLLRLTSRNHRTLFLFDDNDHGYFPNADNIYESKITLWEWFSMNVWFFIQLQ